MYRVTVDLLTSEPAPDLGAQIAEHPAQEDRPERAAAAVDLRPAAHPRAQRPVGVLHPEAYFDDIRGEYGAATRNRAGRDLAHPAAVEALGEGGQAQEHRPPDADVRQILLVHKN